MWLFDGEVLTVPCSRAAHLEGNDTRSYREGYESIVQRNYKRIAEVWFDEYKDCFYYYFPELIVSVGCRVQNGEREFLWEKEIFLFAFHAISHLLDVSPRSEAGMIDNNSRILDN